MHGRLPTLGGADGAVSVDIRWLLDVARRRWPVVAGSTALFAVLALFISFTLTPTYTAVSQILLDPKRSSGAGPDALVSELAIDSSAVESQIAVIKSRALLVRVAQKEKLVDDDEFGAGGHPSALSKITGSVLGLFASAKPDDGSAPLPGSPPPQVLRSAESVGGALAVSRVDRSYVLAISITSRSPTKAARLANAVASAFLVDQLDARYEAARQATEWLGERLDKLRADLRVSEDAVAKYRAENNLVSSVTGTLSESQLSDLNGKLATARAETAEKKAKYDQAQRIIREGGNLQSIPDVLRSAVISNLRAQSAEISRRQADLAARYGDSHPAVVNVRAERQDNDSQIKAEVNRIIANLKNDYEVAQTRERSLEASLGVSNGSSDNSAVALRLRELERVASANKALYESFLSRFKVSEGQADLQVRDARVISVADVPKSPSFPKRGLLAFIGLVIGAGAGMGTAFLLESLRRGFVSPDEIEDALSIPVLSSVPLLNSTDLVTDQGKRIPPSYYPVVKPLSRYSESIRNLRSGIQMSDVDQAINVVQLTSLLPAEGKSTLAVSIAQSARTTYPRVLIVDCDLRRPGATKILGIEKKAGLVDVLIGTSSVENAMTHDPRTGLYMMGAGSSTQNPGDLLASARMKSLVDQFRQAFDYVVLDSPPVGPVIDAVILSKIVDKVVFVVAWNATPRELVGRAIAQFSPAKKVAGVVLNKVHTIKSRAYSGYYYYSKAYDKYYSGD